MESGELSGMEVLGKALEGSWVPPRWRRLPGMARWVLTLLGFTLSVLRVLRKVLRHGVEMCVDAPGEEEVLLVPSVGSGDCDGLREEGLSPSSFPLTLSLEDRPSDFDVPEATVRLLLASERRFRFRRKFPLSNIFSQFGSRVQ